VIHDLGAFLGEIHLETAPVASALVERFANQAMRNVHGHQLFTLPRHPNLDRRTAIRIDDELRRAGVMEAIEGLRPDYFHRQDALVHGDVKAANVLLREGRIYLIDAEFAHIGDPAFDVGTCLAHCLMGLMGASTFGGREEVESVLMDGYASARGFDPHLRERAVRYAGLDIVYHVVGPARLSFLEDLPLAERAIDLGVEMLLA
jgi:5-methylthioribose kinase